MANENAETQPPTNEGAGTPPAEQLKPEAEQETQPKTEEQPKPKTFTQDELNSFLAKQKKDWERKAKLSDDEKKDDEIKSLRTSLQERDNRDSVKAEAKKLGVNNPDLLYKAVKSDLEFDDKGNITNLATLLESAKTDFPQLFTTTPASQGSADGGAGNNKPTTLTKEIVENMSTAEINADWENVQEFMKTLK